MTEPFPEQTEVTGHPLAHLVMSLDKSSDGSAPSEMDIFLTIRHFDQDENEGGWICFDL